MARGNGIEHLWDHVTGAIERGEAVPIVALEAVKTCQSCNATFTNLGDTCEDCLWGDLGSVDFEG